MSPVSYRTLQLRCDDAYFCYSEVLLAVLQDLNIATKLISANKNNRKLLTSFTVRACALHFLLLNDDRLTLKSLWFPV